MKISRRFHTMLVSIFVIVLCLSIIPVITMAAQETRADNSEIGFTSTKQNNPAEEEDGDIRVPIGSLPATNPTEPSETVHVHTWVSYEAVAPGCETEGNIAYQQCSECGEAQTMGENPVPLSKFGWILGATGHNYVEGVCSNCQAEDPEYVPATLPGDYNGDDQVTNADVVALLWNSLFPEDYPLDGDGDLNHDGQITNGDVVALLWYSLFPEDYPLR